MRARFLLVVIATSSHLVYSQNKTFVKEYTYKASEADSKVSCRAIAINQLRSLLLNELGVYVESNQLLKTDEEAGKNAQDFVENISTISAGITKLDVLNETWNGETFWMKAAITVDTTSLAASLKRISEDHRKMRELEELKQRLTDANQRMYQLSQELTAQKEMNAKIALEEKYNARVKEISAGNSMYNAKAKYESKDYSGAIEDFSKVITLDPGYALAYAYRGHARVSLEDYSAAINDFDKAIELRPKFDVAYVDRGRAKSFLGDYPGAQADFSAAIEISPTYANAFFSRGEIKLKMKNYEAAVLDFNYAIKYSPKSAIAYLSRGMASNWLKNGRNACSDWNKAGELGCAEAIDLLRKYCK